MDAAATRTWTTLCHASAFVGFFVPGVGHIFPPLLVWLLKRGESSEVDEHGKESLNFQITMLIYNIISGILCLVFIGFILLLLLHVLNFVLVLIATVKANEGQLFRYPFTLRLIK